MDCTSLARVLAPGSLARGGAADPAKVFKGCPVLLAGAGRTLWHPTMHAWCTAGQRDCVLAVLVAELRSDRQDEEMALLLCWYTTCGCCSCSLSLGAASAAVTSRAKGAS